MVKYPQIIKMWLELQDGKRPIVIWWEPIDPDETIFRVATSFGIFVLRSHRGDVIATEENSWSRSD